MAARNTSGDAGKVNSHTRYKLTLAELEAFNSADDNRLTHDYPSLQMRYGVLTTVRVSDEWLSVCAIR